MKKIVVTGSGFAGMSAACFMAKAGCDVTVIEKNAGPGGRAAQLKAAGFTFDMGPSWYWMPDVFERFFNCFGKKVSDYYQLNRLDPSYRVYWPSGYTDIPADYNQLKSLFESLEAGSGKSLDAFLAEAAFKYETGIKKLVFKPGISITEFADADVIKGLFKLDVFTSMKKHVRKFFKNPKLQELLEFPVLFLGALPQDTPALYSLMNYADIKLGTWYPQGGMYSIVNAMYELAKELGVKFYFDHAATAIDVADNKAIAVIATKKQTDSDNAAPEIATFHADYFIAGADYHFTETKLLAPEYRSYAEAYWEKRVLAPSSILFYVGISKKLKNVQHHSLFFDVSFKIHGEEIYTNPQWPSEPLFYVSVTSVTDDTVAPEGYENLFFLIPVAAGLSGDTEELREKYFDSILKRFEDRIGEPIKDSIVYKKSFAVSDFKETYNSFKGNAYGLANTLMQTALLKPSIRSKKVKNLFYTGQLTVPGPGVPPSLISGEVVAGEVIKQLGL